jgi:hypothetical protein
LRRRIVFHLDQRRGEAQFGRPLSDQLNGEGDREEPVVGGCEQPGEENGDTGGEQLQAQRAPDEEPDAASRGDAEGGLGWLSGLELLQIRL